MVLGMRAALNVGFYVINRAVPPGGNWGQTERFPPSEKITAATQSSYAIENVPSVLGFPRFPSPISGRSLSEAKLGSLLTRRNVQTHRSVAQVQSDSGSILGIPSGPDCPLRA